MSSWKGKTRGGVLGYKIFILIIKYFGLSFAYFLLYFVVAYFMITSSKAFTWIFRFYHKTLRKNVFISFTYVYRNYYLFGQILIDKIAMLAGFQSSFTFDFEGEEYLRQMDNGGFLISAHVGNWEIAGQLLNRLEKRINIIMYDAEHEQIKGYLSDVFVKRNIHFIIIREDYSHLAEIRQALMNKEIIAMHGDRFIEGNKTVMVDFMGKPAAFPVGPVNMAARFNVPVSYVFALKETKKHYHFYATPLKTFTFTRNLKLRDELLVPAVSEYAGELEKIVRKYPLEWFNYYDFWKVPEPTVAEH
jgi:predicted LPLAT superfamily acyltransferase